MKQLLLILMLLTASSSALALDEINTTYFENVAIECYDAVAYFTEQRAVEGSKKHETNYKDANWRFASAANIAAFRQTPNAMRHSMEATAPRQFRRMTLPASIRHNLLCTMGNYI
jgi:predicted GTPase